MSFLVVPHLHPIRLPLMPEPFWRVLQSCHNSCLGGTLVLSQILPRGYLRRGSATGTGLPLTCNWGTLTPRSGTGVSPCLGMGYPIPGNGITPLGTVVPSWEWDTLLPGTGIPPGTGIRSPPPRQDKPWTGYTAVGMPLVFHAGELSCCSFNYNLWKMYFLSQAMLSGR